MLKKVILLVVAGYALVIALVIGLALIVIPGMDRLHSISSDIYTHPFIVNDAAQETKSAISLMRADMLDIVSPNSPEELKRLIAETFVLDKDARKNLIVVEENFLGDIGRVKEIGHLLDEWQNLRAQEIDLVTRGQMIRAHNLVEKSGTRIFTQLLANTDYVINFSRQKAASFVKKSDDESVSHINLTGWFLAGLIAVIAITGWMVAHRIATLIRREEQMEKELHLNEQGALVLLALDSKADKLDEKELLQEGLEEAERLTASQIAYLHFVNEDQQSIELVIWSKRTREHCEVAFDNHYPIAAAGVWADCARTKQPVMHNDYQSLSDKHGYPEGHAHVIRHLSVPALEGGLVRLIMGVGNKADDYSQADSRLLQLIANNLWRVVQRRRAEEALRKNSVQLEASNKELESFSYSVSHDLRTPLRAIDGFSRILLDDYVGILDDEGKRLLNVVRDNTQKMGQLIDDILAFSRTGRLEMVPIEVNMTELVRDVVEELKPTIAGRNVKFEIKTLPPTLADRAMMRRVMVNLLSNAIKFTRLKAAALIEVGAITGGKETIYYVKDNGAGFDMQYVDKLFGVFQRLHGPAEFEGTGIGLAIVKRILTRQGGRVWAESKLNEGATIYFALPTKEKNHE
jgi:signal transduction histidine kinase